MAKRYARREEANEGLAEAQEAGTAEDVEKFAKRTVKVSKKHNEEAKRLLRLMGVPYWTSIWPARFEAGVVTLSGGRKMEVDYLACGYGLVPNTEAAQLIGCRLDDGFVAVDSRQETTIQGVYCAGEPAGIGGLDKYLPLSLKLNKRINRRGAKALR